MRGAGFEVVAIVDDISGHAAKMARKTVTQYRGRPGLPTPGADGRYRHGDVAVWRRSRPAKGGRRAKSWRARLREHSALSWRRRFAWRDSETGPGTGEMLAVVPGSPRAVIG